MIFDAFDAMSEAAFLWWVVKVALALGAFCAMIMAARWVVRRAMWLWATRDTRPLNDKIITNLIYGRSIRSPRKPYKEWATQQRRQRRW